MIFQLTDVGVRARKQLVRFAKKHPKAGNNKTMQGYCAIGSWLVHGIAQKSGIHTNIVGGWAFLKVIPKRISTNHVWCEGRGHVIDITVHQFRKSFPDIYIPKKNQYYHVTLNEPTLMSDFLKWDAVNNPLNYEHELQKLIDEA